MLQNLKALLGILVVGAIVYVGAMVGPHYFAYFQFKDDVATIAKFGATSDKSEDSIRAEVFAKAQQYKVSLREEDILITRQESSLAIKAKYSETVVLIGGKKLLLQFDASATNVPKPVPGG